MRIEELEDLYFACTGNTCRSPLAQRIMQEKLNEKNSEMSIQSRMAEVKSERWDGRYGGGRISRGSARIIVEKYGDRDFVRNHISQFFSSKELEEADLVLTMEKAHKEELLRWPEAYTEDKQLKVYTLGEILGEPNLDVNDPLIEGSRLAFSQMNNDSPKSEHELYEETFHQLDDLIDRLFEVQEIPFTTLDDSFKQEMTKRYENWKEKTKKSEGLLDKILYYVDKVLLIPPDTRKFDQQRYGQKDYDSAFRRLTTQKTNFMDLLLDTAEMYEHIAEKCKRKGVKESVEQFTTTLHNEVIPLLISGEDCLKNEWEIDYARVGAPLSEELVSATRYIPELLTKSERDLAIYISNFAHQLVDIATLVCSDEAVESMYNNLLEASPPGFGGTRKSVDRQDAINARYREKSNHSITKFNGESKAYRFTNEPLKDVLTLNGELKGSALAVTASGDMLCILGGLGVNEIHSVDVSPYANAWAEYKFQGFLRSSFEEFSEAFLSGNATWKTFPFDLPVSDDAQLLFENLQGSEKSLEDSTEIFQNQGYAASNPNLVGFTEESVYNSLHQNAQETSVHFYPIDLVGFFKEEDIPQGYFGVMYLSNVLDHVKSPISGSFDLSGKRMKSILQPIVEYLDEDGKIILNLQWGERAKEGVEEALSSLGFSLNKLPNETGGCGYMYVAHR